MRREQGQHPRAGTLLERAVAYLADSLLTAALWLFVAGSLAGFDLDRLVSDPTIGALAGLLFLSLPFAYFVLAEAAAGTTPGKRLVGLRVRTIDHEPPGLFAATVRNTLRLAWALGPLGPLFLLADAMLVQATERDQRAGDLAARTLVVREGPAVFTP